jgi:hypothetical protein
MTDAKSKHPLPPLEAVQEFRAILPEDEASIITRLRGLERMAIEQQVRPTNDVTEVVLRMVSSPPEWAILHLSAAEHRQTRLWGRVGMEQGGSLLEKLFSGGKHVLLRLIEGALEIET